MDRREYLALATAGLVTLAGCGGDDGTPTDALPESDDETEPPAESTPSATEADQSESVRVGEVAEGANLAMVVEGVERTTQIDEFQEAGEGNEYVVVTLSVKNTTDGDFLNFSGFLQTQVRDDEDVAYNQAIAVTDNTFDGGQLVPGEVSRGDVVYEVPQDASGLTLSFDFESFSFTDFERVTVDLEQEAGSIASLEQSLRVDVRDLGEEVSFADVTAVANDVEFTDSLGDFAQAAEGREFAVVDVTTENGTDEEQHISTLLQMPVKDGEGNSYDVSITGQSALDQAYAQGQPLGPGETRSGQVAYEVPADAEELYWIFEFTLWTDGDKTFWGLR